MITRLRRLIGRTLQRIATAMLVDDEHNWQRIAPQADRYCTRCHGQLPVDQLCWDNLPHQWQRVPQPRQLRNLGVGNNEICARCGQTGLIAAVTNSLCHDNLPHSWGDRYVMKP